MGFVPARVCGAKEPEIQFNSTERLKLRGHIAHGAGRKHSTSFSIPLEVEAQQELATAATTFLGRTVLARRKEQ